MPAFFVSIAQQAGKGHGMKVTQRNRKLKQNQILMVIADGVILDADINPFNVSRWYSGHRKYRIMLIDVTEDKYNYVIKGKNRDLICYPESNRFEQYKHLFVIRRNNIEVIEHNGFFRKIISHMEKYGWFYGAVIQLIGTAVLAIIGI